MNATAIFCYARIEESLQVICKIDKKLANLDMLSTQNHSPQLGFFSGLADQLNQKHPIYLLAGKINWPLFDEAFKKYYSEKMGAPAKPIRLMVSLLILKYVRNLSDENMVEQWSENNYFQYFSGAQFSQPKTSHKGKNGSCSPRFRYCVPFKEIFNYLKSKNFEGWLCLEEWGNKGTEGVKQGVDFVRETWAKA